MLSQLKKDLNKLANKEQAQLLQRFFKTGKGQYGEGDIFLGIKVPDQRQVAKKYQNIELDKLQHLLDSKIHEYRLVALLILTYKFPKAANKQEIINFYLNNTKNINNWDLVDLSASQILGNYLLDKPRDILYKLAKSNNLWEKRISIVSTYTFIKNNQLQDTIKLSEILLTDKHDLMHKAVGWMLRELGKKDQQILEQFIKQHYNNIPRTTLRYAIERFEETKRQQFLKGDII